MTSTELPAMSYEEGSLHLVLLPELDTNPPSFSLADQYPESDFYPQLTSARYGDPSPVAPSQLQQGLDQGIQNEYERLGYDATQVMPSDETVSSQTIPVHPIPSLQDAFTESLFEVTGSAYDEKPKLRLLDRPGRREALLAQGKDDAPFDASWRMRPGQSQHEIAKLISQISFGVYLLLDGNAESSVQVVDILQGHIDEVDEFLEVILEDLAEAEMDINARVDELTQPMANMASFERSLEDRKYRAELLERNQFIEHVIARTNAALRQWENDIEAGLRTTAAFINWLNGHIEGSWRTEQPHLLEIFDAMKGNAEGWLLAFEKMSDSAQDMTNLIIKLMNTMSDAEKKAGEVSRKNWANNAPFSSPWGANGRASSRRTSTASSLRSRPKSITRGSIRNGSIPRRRPPSSIMSGGSDDAMSMDFPLPGCVSLLPPPMRFVPPKTDKSNQDDGFRLSPATYSPLVKPSPSPIPQVLEDDDEEEVERCEATQSPVYVLQPRTYTPQPPAPLPSPMVKDYSARNTQSTFRSHTYSDSQASSQSSYSMTSRAQTWEPTEIPQKRISLRQRVSLRASPPHDIRIPSRSLEGMEVYIHSSNNTTPRTTPSTSGSSDYQSQVRSSASQRSSPSPGILSTTSSPHADQQYYHPVLASRHSPLQQRPHTAAGSGLPMSQHPMLVPPPLLRNRPSHFGGMSVASDKMSRSDDGRQDGTGMRSSKSSVQLKKKKSAFGWLKKAFSMDEEERAAYEARKAMQHHDRYYDAPVAPKFLDGRRVR